MPRHRCVVLSHAGQEKEVIIFSAVRANEQGRVGFLADRRRLNVAVTRARRGLIVIGCQKTLSHDPTWRQVLAGALIFPVTIVSHDSAWRLAMWALASLPAHLGAVRCPCWLHAQYLYLLYLGLCCSCGRLRSMIKSSLRISIWDRHPNACCVALTVNTCMAVHTGRCYAPVYIWLVGHRWQLHVVLTFMASAVQ